ncbi:MAG: chaperonin GroEL [Simkaniaceae bacterium]
MADSAKEILFEEQAREKLKTGVEKLAKAVAATLGPKGMNVGIDESFGAPKITNDGGSIVQTMELKDQYENMGVSMGKEVAGKIKDKCGDGTTSGIILLNALVQKGVKNIASGASPIHIKRGMEKGLEKILQEISKISIPVKSKQETENIATVSASGDKEVGKMITEAFTKVGSDGVITIEEGKGTETTLEVVEGMQFDRGYLSAYFCTEQEKRLVEMSHPRILLTDKKINSVQDILPVLQNAASAGEELLIIADDVEGDVLSTLVVNKLRGTLKVCAVKAPGFGDRRKAMLGDLAVLTGATVVSEDAGMQLKDAGPDVLGSAEKIEVSKDHTIIIGGKGKPDAVQARIHQIENEINNAKSSYDIEKLQERKAKLSGGVAVIRVGAPTEPEMKQKKQIFEDSLNSTTSAQEEGIVPGGGIALLRASRAVDSLNLEEEEKLGAQILKEACIAPVRQIIQNSGFDPSIILEEIYPKENPFGFNAVTEKVEDLIQAGVIDPAKVVKNALHSAVSIAGVILISEALIGEAPEDENL